MKKVLIGLGVIVLILVLAVGSFYAIYLRPFMAQMAITKEIPYDKNLTLVLGGGGNSGIFTGDSLVVVIDSKQDDAAEKLYEKAKEPAGEKPILLINTHFHSDHTSGNKLYKGAQILAGGNYTKEAWIKANSAESLPTIWLKNDTNIVLSADDTLTVFGLNRNIHSASDLFVYDHKRKMLFGGDVILNKKAPVLIMPDQDADGYLYAFDEIPKRYDVEVVVPGHGEVGGKEVITDFKQFFLDAKAASGNDSLKNEVLAKYENWGQIPFLMSTEATIKAFEKKAGK